MPTKYRKRVAANFQIEGIRQLTDQLKDLDKAVVGPYVYDVLGKATYAWKRRFIQEAQSKNWPKKAIKSAFTFSKESLKERRRGRATALFGIRKAGRLLDAPGYVEWFGKKQGRTIGMSLATMFEFGTGAPPNPVTKKGTRMSARPAFRPSVYASREAMKNIIEDGVWEILERVAGKKRPVSQQMPGIGGEFD